MAELKGGSTAGGSLILTQANASAPTLTSTIATGTAPLDITSTTKVTNLNVDKLDNQEGSYYLDWTNTTNKPDTVITLSGDATGNVTLTNLASGTLTVAVVDDSHNHIVSNVDGLQTALDGKEGTHDHPYRPDTWTPVRQAITNGVTTTSPSEDAVYDALAGKANTHTHPYRADTWTPVIQTISNGVTATSPSENAVFDALALKSDNHSHPYEPIHDHPYAPDTHPAQVATSSVLGHIKSGTDITIDSNGNVSVNDDSHIHDGRYYTESETNTRYAKLGDVANDGNHYFNRRMAYLENVSPQYWILCENGANNDVNGSFRVDRTSGNYQASHLDVIVSSGTSSMYGGSLTSHQVLQSSEKYKLVSITYNTISYIAIKYTGNTYPVTSGLFFTGRLASTAGSATFTAIDGTGVSNEAEFGGNSKFNFDVDAVKIKENTIWHEGNFNPSTKANLASPALTGTPTAPTATTGTNTTQIASTAFVQTAMGSAGLGDMLKSAYDSNADGIVNSADTLSGLTATIAELNHVDGVTSAIQTQINAKAPTSHASSATTYGVSSTTNYGHAKLSTAINSTSTTLASTPSAVKQAYDLANSKTNIQVNAVQPTTQQIGDLWYQII